MRDKTIPYVGEKLYMVLHGVFMNTGSIVSRVANSVDVLARINDEDFSDEDLTKWHEIKAILKSEEGSYANNINNLDEVQCNEFLEKVLSLFVAQKW